MSNTDTAIHSETLTAFGHSFMGLRAAYAWAERHAAGPFSCVVQIILGEGADVPIVIAFDANHGWKRTLWKRSA